MPLLARELELVRVFVQRARSSPLDLKIHGQHVGGRISDWNGIPTDVDFAGDLMVIRFVFVGEPRRANLRIAKPRGVTLRGTILLVRSAGRITLSRCVFAARRKPPAVELSCPFFV